MIVFLAATAILKVGNEVSRPSLFLTWVISPWLACWFRMLVRRHALRKSGFWLRRVLIIGGGEEAAELARRMQTALEMGYQVVGHLADDPSVLVKLMPVLGGLADLEQVIADVAVDEVVIALPGESRLKQFSLLKRSEPLVPRVFILPQLFDSDKLNVEVERVDRYFLLAFPNNLVKKSNRLLKNAFEILIVFVFLPLWGSFLLILALAVKFSSPGAIFFRQQRIGAGGRPFSCLKFRTMVVDSEQQLVTYLANNPVARQEWEDERKLKYDPRVTPFGALLRKTSLDELPQLLNIVRGEMSLVGPRPIVLAEVSKYGEYIQYYNAVSPGLTGLWQVSGRNDIGYRQRVMLDTFYVRNWSLWLDFMILMRTIPAVMKKDGAY
jgi:undecaprenyl-phosphate galactose phosphotransferase